MRTVLILGITSDIGRELAGRYLRDGWAVHGTCRPATKPAGLPDACRLYACDFAVNGSIDAFGAAWAQAGEPWDLIVVGAGTEEPIGSFWDCPADAWEQGIAVNALGPLRLLRLLHPLRRPGGKAAVALFSGSGTNNAAPAYSAYCASKIFLIKMCELLDAESPDTSFFIIGPGIVRTKIHEQTLREPERSGPNYRKVVDFLASGNPGTSHDDIYACIQWCVEAGKATVGGRNLSLVYDAWRQGGAALAEALRGNPNIYKLRRFGNDLNISAPSP